MCVDGKHFERYGIYIFAIVVLGEVQLDQLRDTQGRAIYWVGSMLLYPRHNVFYIEERAALCANWVFERLEGQRAVVEGQAFEGIIGCSFGFGDTSTSAG
jgi:hypothetical protein